MISSSNFFNKSVFTHEEDFDGDGNEMGPWHVSNRRRKDFCNLSSHEKSIPRKRYERQIAQSSIHNLKHSLKSEIEENRVQSFNSQNTIPMKKYEIHQIRNLKLPKIDISSKRKFDEPKETSVIASIMNSSSPTTPAINCSPLVTELNLKTRKLQKRESRKNHITTEVLSTAKEKEIERLMGSKFAYDIYERCIVETKKNVKKMKEFHYNLSTNI